MNIDNPFILIKNNAPSIDFNSIVMSNYSIFCETVITLMASHSNHIVMYYGFKNRDDLQFICAIARDMTKDIAIFGFELSSSEKELKSLTNEVPQIFIFEREIHENFGILFAGNRWLKPVRYSKNRSDSTQIMSNYPFYSIESEELHEIGVGPIHAGIIEPGHFRFICNGEKILHLEIQLGYQHRGVESLFLTLENGLQRVLLSENIAGDSTIGHGLAHCQLMESLAQTNMPIQLQIERIIALELERIAIHIGDTSAMCTDVAYQLGQVVNEALRTTIINTTQLWCGNRFGKGLIRPNGTHYPISDNFIHAMTKTLNESGKNYMEIADRIYTLPSILSRFDSNGIVTQEQAMQIGAVGMVARSVGIPRDIRTSHPFQGYNTLHYTPILRSSGDVLSRGMLRNLEVRHSIKIIRSLIDLLKETSPSNTKPQYDIPLRSNSFSISIVEGWRGEICHCAITDSTGKLMHYKVKDPSMHNWSALALAVRNHEISDFPINNKSFNLSYCGFDL